MYYVKIVLEIIVAIGILNVWLLRFSIATPYRGGNATNMREEFAVYGLPYWVMCMVAVLKVGLALSLLAAIWNNSLARPAGIGLGVLMLAAIVMHIKARDPLKKSMPAIAILVMCALIALL